MQDVEKFFGITPSKNEKGQSTKNKQDNIEAKNEKVQPAKNK